MTGPAEASTRLIEAFRQGLQDLGYVDGQNIKIEFGWNPPERPELLPDIASSLVRSKPDVLVGPTTAHVLALKQVTSAIPIVMIAPSDPVGTGLVQSLARPGGNVTGTAFMSRDVTGKRLELLKEAVAKLARVGDLWNPVTPSAQGDFREIESAARTLGISLYSAEAREPSEFASAFSAIARARADALIVQADQLTWVHRKQIVSLALQNRLPSMFFFKEYVDDGGLMSYGANVPDLYRRSAGYVVKILKGAKPADLPVEQPTKFELIINLKTAKALGMTIPESLLLRADEVIR
ncbi:MAG TPA: ABC transporter substrate-binding protein [Burkholderiales bacterium]|nr:ABC transporter substrate-binding protein [Burkholderiales bacterium]